MSAPHATHSETAGQALVVTAGEPGGIGPDIILESWRAVRRSEGPVFAVAGCARSLRERAGLLGIDVTVTAISHPGEALRLFDATLPVIDRPLDAAVTPGQADAAHAPAVIGWLRMASDLCLTGAAAGLVTGPIQKESLYRAGFVHQGSTDFLAHLSREAGHQAEPVMMLSAGSLRTVPLTVHVPLARVPGLITATLIATQVRIIDRDLKRYFGLQRPRIAVAGLNPHAGEGGSLGTEETAIIAPALAALAAEGYAVSGPFSADTLFHEEARAGYDLALCMYHDQALIPVKTIGFHDGINTTLGLPYVRTSPDHGTALNLAGSGQANASSMLAALRQAAQMAAAATS